MEGFNSSTCKEGLACCKGEGGPVLQATQSFSEQQFTCYLTPLGIEESFIKNSLDNQEYVKPLDLCSAIVAWPSF